MSFAKIIERLSPTNNGRLYHYTTQSGLLGILNEKEIWATHTQYLNDANEFIHASDIVRDIIREMSKNPESHEDKISLNQMLERIEGHESINVCVTSFSTDPDSLSQWRAYGGGSSGFAVGFSAESLRSLASENYFSLVKCIYNESEQYILLKNLVCLVLQEIKTWKPRYSYDTPLEGGNLAAYLNQVAPAIKHPKFEVENEWRLISRPLMCSSERFAFREGKSMLLPYYKFPIIGNNVTQAIEEVIVGPTPNMNQAVAATRSLMVRHKLDIKGTEVEDKFVKESSIPYRNW